MGTPRASGHRHTGTRVGTGRKTFRNGLGEVPKYSEMVWEGSKALKNGFGAAKKKHRMEQKAWQMTITWLLFGFLTFSWQDIRQSCSTWNIRSHDRNRNTSPLILGFP